MMYCGPVLLRIAPASHFPLSRFPPDGSVTEPDMSACFCPDHKAPMVLFLDRVYGIEDQSFLLHLLEVGFLPDLRAAASLDTVDKADSLPTERSSASLLSSWSCFYVLYRCSHFF